MQSFDRIGSENSLIFTLIVEPQANERRRVLCISLRESTADDDSRWVLSCFHDVQDVNFHWRKVEVEDSRFNDDDEGIAAFRSRVAAVAVIGREPKLEVTKRPADDSSPQNYVRCHLQLLSTKSSSPYNCYIVTDAVYRRLDRQPLTETDIKALRGLCWGQIHGVTVAADGLTAKVHSECDSSD